MSTEVAFIRLMLRIASLKFMVSFQYVIAAFSEKKFNRVIHLSQLHGPKSLNQSKSRNQSLTQRGTAESDTKDLE